METIILSVVMLQGVGIFKYPLGLSGSYFFILLAPVTQWFSVVFPV
jgi:hypothetical protein